MTIGFHELTIEFPSALLFRQFRRYAATSGKIGHHDGDHWLVSHDDFESFRIALDVYEGMIVCTACARQFSAAQLDERRVGRCVKCTKHGGPDTKGA